MINAYAGGCCQTKSDMDVGSAFWVCFVMSSSKTVQIYELFSALAGKDYLKNLNFSVACVGTALY